MASPVMPLRASSAGRTAYAGWAHRRRARLLHRRLGNGPGVVLHLDRGAEGGHQRITNELVDRAAVLVDLWHQLSEVEVEQLQQVGGLVCPGISGRGQGLQPAKQSGERSI